MRPILLANKMVMPENTAVTLNCGSDEVRFFMHIVGG